MQTMQIQIRLQSDQGLHCLLFHLCLFDTIRDTTRCSLASCLNFRLICNTAKFSGIPKFRNFTVWPKFLNPQKKTRMLLAVIKG